MTRDEMDASSKEGAQRLARDIAGYWGRRGGIVRTWVVAEMNPKKSDRALWMVRTDMVNGLPRRWEA